MTRINQTLAFATLATTLVATGCGEAGSFDQTGSEDTRRAADDAVSADSTTPTREEELELACEAFCYATASCRRVLAEEDCVGQCVNKLGPEADDPCIAAQIDFLNCYSASSCAGPVDVIRSECGEAALELRVGCGPSELRRDLEEDGGAGVIRVIEHDPADGDGDPDETEPGEELGDEDPEESEDRGPVFELPEIPELPYFPEPGAAIELP